MDRLSQDLRFAVRSLVRTPGLAIVAILSLAFGIGANSAVFSLVNTVLIRPLSFAEPDRLVMVFERARGFDHGNVSGHEFVAWRDQTRSFDHLAMYTDWQFTLTGHGEATTLVAQLVSADFFGVLGQRPMLGRVFRSGEDQPGAARVAVIGHALWRDRFGGDSSVIGQRITLDDAPYEIVGVMSGRGDLGGDVWVPMNVLAEARKVGKHSNFVIGRLAPGAGIRSAQTDLDVVAKRLEQQYPSENRGHTTNVVSLYEETVGDARRPLIVALGATAFVFLLACANVAHLLLTRTAARQKELAIRTALGAARLRLIRQLVTEALLLSAIGGALGLVVATWVSDLVPGLAAAGLPRLWTLDTDWHVLAVTAILCLTAGGLCGLAPAIRVTSPRLKLWLGDGMRTSTEPGRRIAGFLVVSEVAIALILLVGAGLTVKSFARMIQVRPGFEPHDVLAVGLPLPGPRYADAEQQRRAVDQLVDRIARIPNVQAAGATTTLPLGPCCNNMGITIEGKPAPAPGTEITARMTIVAGQYFDAMRIPLRAGRTFNASDRRVAVPLIRWYPEQPPPLHFDDPQPAPVAVISETMANRYWTNEPVLGKRFRVLSSPWITVVGVVGDVRQSALIESPTPEMYLSDLQEPIGAMTVVLRTAGNPTLVGASVREQITEFDKQLPVGAAQTMERVMWNSVGRARFNALLFGAAGAIALLLAVIGVYGVISYSVARRTREIGIRLALGAQVSDVLQLVLGQAAGLVSAGIVVGVAGALALTRVLGTLLYDVGPHDPATFVLVGSVLAGVALAASYFPGKAAIRVDPSEALRSD